MKSIKTFLILSSIILVFSPVCSKGQSTEVITIGSHEYATLVVASWSLNVYYKSGEIEETKREKGEEFWTAVTKKLNQLSDNGWIVTEFIWAGNGYPIYLLRKEK